MNVKSQRWRLCIAGALLTCAAVLSAVADLELIAAFVDLEIIALMGVVGVGSMLVGAVGMVQGSKPNARGELLTGVLLLVMATKLKSASRAWVGSSCKPGRSLSQNIALHLQWAHLPPQARQFLALGRGQDILARQGLAAVDGRSRDPVDDGLRVAVKLSRKLRRRAAGLRKFNHLATKFRRIRRLGLRHLGTPSSVRIGVREIGSTPVG